MQLDELETLLVTLRKHGVKTYSALGDSLTVEFERDTPAPLTGEAPLTMMTDKERVDLEEKLLFASSEGFPTG